MINPVQASLWQKRPLYTILQYRIDIQSTLCIIFIYSLLSNIYFLRQFLV